VLRHAQATEVALDITHEDGQLCIAITDNGRGFDVRGTYERALRGESLGVLNMQERAGMVGGRVDVESGPGRTQIQVRMPVTRP